MHSNWPSFMVLFCWCLMFV